jgi:aryl-alcohol dehydrogenase-like predicted oxidoreductase
MRYRDLGETGMQVSEISLGTWAFGGDWGLVGEDDAYAALNRAVDLGVNFLDTADAYGDGRSERLIGRLLKERTDDEILVATKAGRRLDPTPPRATTTRTSRPSSSGAWITSVSRPSTYCNCTARRRTLTVRTLPSRRWIA